MKNTDIIEISNRIEDSEERGFSCGPFCSYVVAVETVLEVNGQKIYLTSTWVDMAPEEIEEDITRESIFDTLLMRDEEVERLDNLRDECFRVEGDVHYREYFSRMSNQIVEKLQEVGTDKSVINMLLGIEDEEDYDDDEDEEYEESTVGSESEVGEEISNG